jgi:hypothetical protein
MSLAMMSRLPAVARRCLAVATMTAAFAACGGDDPEQPTSLAGTYAATTLLFTPPDRPQIDVLAQGGALTLTIAADNRTSGTLSVPASAAGGTAFTASMAGTAVREGGLVHFEQSADSFVRDLVFTVGPNTLTARQTLSAGTGYTVTLTKQ